MKQHLVMLIIMIMSCYGTSDRLIQSILDIIPHGFQIENRAKVHGFLLSKEKELNDHYIKSKIEAELRIQCENAIKERNKNLIRDPLSTHYQILDVPITARAFEINRAYKKLAKQFHPDKYPNEPEGTELFQRLHEAYDVLSDPAKRQRYEQQLRSSVEDSAKNAAAWTIKINVEKLRSILDTVRFLPEPTRVLWGSQHGAHLRLGSDRIPLQTASLCHIVSSDDEKQGDVEAPIHPKDQSAVWRPITSKPPRSETSVPKVSTQIPVESKPSEVESSLLIDLPNDASSLIGQYLKGNKGDLWKLRRASRHFNRLYDDPSKFQPLQSLFDPHQDLESERYQSLDDLLESVRCVPDVYVDVKDKEGIHSLSRMHHFFGQEILRGLTKGEEQPFLSFYLWDEKTFERTLEVICVFDKSGSTIVKSLVVGYNHNSKCCRKLVCPAPEYPMTESKSPFDVKKLRDVLNCGSLKYGGKRWILCNSNTAITANRSLYIQRKSHCVVSWLGNGCITISVVGVFVLAFYGMILLHQSHCAQASVNCSHSS